MSICVKQLTFGARAQKVRIGFWLDQEVAKRFKAVSRTRDGGMSQALTRMVGEAIGDARAVSPVGVGQGRMLSIRFRDEERALLGAAARSRETTPSNWVRSLALVHLTRRPQWNRAELDAVREVAREIRRIGANVNQIAHAVNVAAMNGQCPPEAGLATKEAVALLHSETRRLAGLLTGNFDYWGLPDELHPRATAAGLAADAARERRAKRKRELKFRRRPAKFVD